MTFSRFLDKWERNEVVCPESEEFQSVGKDTSIPEKCLYRFEHFING
jgi:hypothetical protein